MDLVAIATGILALVALGVSIFSAVSSHKQGKRLVGIEDWRKETEELQGKKAYVRAWWGQLDQYTRAFVLANDGPANARSIRVYLDDKPIEEHRWFKDEALPSDLGRGVEYPIAVTPSMEEWGDYDCRVEWEDDSEEPGVFTTTLKLTHMYMEQ